MLYVFTGLIIVWSVLLYFFMGEKYMRWYYRQMGRNDLDYDSGRFKIAHSVCVAFVGIFGVLSIILDQNALFLTLMFVAVVINYALILIWCKKKISSK